MNNTEAFEASVTKLGIVASFEKHADGNYKNMQIQYLSAIWSEALAQANVNEQSQSQQPTNVWQQAIDDELVNAHLGVARNEVTREEAKAQLNKLIAWHIDVAKYFESQAQQEIEITDSQLDELEELEKSRSMYSVNEYRNQVRTIFSMQSQAQQESLWISVEERLPDSIREVIGAYWHEEIERFQPIFCCYDADDDDEWISYGDETPYPIRYWMESPLPPAPEGDDK